jgi:hypothetical protein
VPGVREKVTGTPGMIVVPSLKVAVTEAVETPSAVSVGGLTTRLISVAPVCACVGLTLAINTAAAKRPASAETRSSGNLLVARSEMNPLIALSNLPNRASTCHILLLCIRHTPWYSLALNILFCNYIDRLLWDRVLRLATAGATVPESAGVTVPESVRVLA